MKKLTDRNMDQGERYFLKKIQLKKHAGARSIQLIKIIGSRCVEIKITPLVNYKQQALATEIVIKLCTKAYNLRMILLIDDML